MYSGHVRCFNLSRIIAYVRFNARGPHILASPSDSHHSHIILVRVNISRHFAPVRDNTPPDRRLFSCRLQRAGSLPVVRYNLHRHGWIHRWELPVPPFASAVCITSHRARSTAARLNIDHEARLISLRRHRRFVRLFFHGPRLTSSDPLLCPERRTFASLASGNNAQATHCLHSPSAISSSRLSSPLFVRDHHPRAASRPSRLFSHVPEVANQQFSASSSIV